MQKGTPSGHYWVKWTTNTPPRVKAWKEGSSTSQVYNVQELSGMSLQLQRMHLQNTSFKTSCSSFRSFFLFSRLLRCVLLKCTTRNEHLWIYVQRDTGTGFVRRIAGAQIFRNTRTLTPDKPTGYFINNDPRDAPKNVGLRRFLNCVRMINQSIRLCDGSPNPVITQHS